MSTSSQTYSVFKRRQNRSRAKLAVNQTLPRLSVHRSLRHISAQIIDDLSGKTLASANDLKLEGKTDKTETAKLVGKNIAELAKSKKISAVRFDRGANKYHGRVAALAASAREHGLIF